MARFPIVTNSFATAAPTAAAAAAAAATAATAPTTTTMMGHSRRARAPRILSRKQRLVVALAFVLAALIVANTLCLGYWVLTQEDVAGHHRHAVHVPHPGAHLLRVHIHENKNKNRRVNQVMPGPGRLQVQDNRTHDHEFPKEGPKHPRDGVVPSQIDPKRDTARDQNKPKAKERETNGQRQHEKKQQSKQQNEQQQQQQQQQQEQQQGNKTSIKPSLLNCERYGGPFDFDSLDEMVYWKVIPEDWNYRSKFKGNGNEERFLTFDTDLSGFNNQRMVFEINLAMAIVTGRTLVLPRDRYVDHIDKDQNKFAMDDFFDLASIAARLPGVLRILPIDDFIAREGGPDRLDIPTDFVDFQRRLPQLLQDLDTRTKADNNNNNNNSTDGNDYESVLAGWSHHDRFVFENYQDLNCNTTKLGSDHCSNTTDWTSLRHVVKATRTWRYYLDEFFYEHPKVACPRWGAETCLVVIPDRLGDDMTAMSSSSSSSNNTTSGPERFRSWMQSIDRDFISRREKLVGFPSRVNGSPEKRLPEVYQMRQGVCVYDQQMQKQKYYHMRDDATNGYRLMAHWYDYLFFEDWREDLWMKRFFRDELRYHDRLQCAAARIVAAIRKQARTAFGHPDGRFHSLHVRRTDLVGVYRKFDVERNASEIYETVTLGDPVLIPNDSVVYVATDEADKHFFDAFRDRYQRVYFLDDFVHLLGDDLPKEYYGMIDQLVASRGEHFVGTYFSTFTGYINRLRGYHSQKSIQQQNNRTETARKIRSQGVIPSWFYSPPNKKNVYQRYESVSISIFEMEYANAWRNIDLDVDPVLRAALELDEAEE